MRFCNLHARTYNAHLDRWFDVSRPVLDSFSKMLTMTESVCDLCKETEKNAPFLFNPELYTLQNSSY